MMPFFTTPYDDELMYSVIARYHLKSGNNSAESTLIDVFGDRKYSMIFEMQTNFDLLLSNLPIGHCFSSNEFIKNNTMYRYYTAFKSETESVNLLKLMKSDSGKSIFSKAGIIGGQISSNLYIKFCTQCAIEDYEKKGETYWRRIHQVPNIGICGCHGIQLRDSKIISNNGGSKQIFAAGLVNFGFDSMNELYEENRQRIINCNNEPKHEDYNKQINQAQLIIKLLKNDYPRKSFLELQSCYLNRLKDLGYYLSKSRIHQEKLQIDFTIFFTNEYLIQNRSQLDDASNLTWLNRITRKSNTNFHPNRHLLLMQFLNLTLDDVFNSDIPNQDYIKSRKLQIKSEIRKLNERTPDTLISKQRMNWKSRDIEVLELVKNALHELTETNSKPLRVSINSIGKKIGKASLLAKQLDKMPNTHNYLIEQVETLEDYRRRKLLWAIKELKNQNIKITRTRVVRTAGLKKKEYLDLIKSEIDEELELQCQF